VHEQTVLITGASAGIGEAVAYAFAERGSRLFLVARRSDRLKQVVETCEKRGASAVAFSVHDLARPGEGGEVVRGCLREMNDLGILICNAGYGIQAPVTETTPEMMSRLWQVNYQSAYESIHEALPYFLQKRRGHIILTSSILGKKGTPFSAAYAATKFAQVGLGESLWGELRGSGVDVTVICPGYTATEFHDVLEHGETRIKIKRPFKGQSPELVAAAMVNAVVRKRREVYLTLSGKALLLLDRISPSISTRIMAYVGRKYRERTSSAKSPVDG